ncbi:MAG: lysophospholipid acyltransferase family protein [Sandaracinaceae bacterium]
MTRLSTLPTWLAERLGTDELDRALGRLREEMPAHDPWGFSPEEARLYALVNLAFYRYFRTEVHGIEHLPRGRVLIVPNHSGQLPYDGLVVSMACLLDADPPRWVRSMVERWVPTLPFINVAMARSGAVLGDPVNCRNLLRQDNAILVFPEGARGSGKTFWKRYQLERFGRGFMRLALETDTPIVPVSVVGAEEAVVSLVDLKPLARLFGAPYFPVTPLLPVLGPLQTLPLPTRFYLDFGEPLRFEGPADDEDEAIDRKVEVVRQAVRTSIEKRLAARPGVFG